MDYGDLKEDKNIQEKLENFHESVVKIENLLETALKPETYEKLSVKQKIDYDLFLTYTLNTLYWLYLRTRGVDPNKNEVKKELSRIKEFMVKAKQAHERNTIRPTLDKEAAGRFIKHGIQHSEQKFEENKKKRKREGD